MKGKIKKRKVVRIQYYTYCHICPNLEIKGNSRSQVVYALNTHLKQKHPKK